MTPSTYEILVALAILAGFAIAFVAMLVDLDRLRRAVESDELWDDEEVGADDALLWASSSTVSPDDLAGGFAWNQS